MTETTEDTRVPRKKPADVDDDCPVIGVAAVAWFLKISERQVRRLANRVGSAIHAARLPPEVVGDSLRFRRDDIMRLIAGSSAKVLPMRRGA